MNGIILFREGGNKILFIIRAMTLIALCIIFPAQSPAQIQTDVPALKDVYANDFYIGCLLSYTHVGFADDTPVPGQTAPLAPVGTGGSLIKFHMNSMSPGNNMKPQFTVNLNASAAAYTAASAADKDSVNTHPVISFNGNLIAQLNWAKKQGFTFRGHTLVWHSQTPGTGFFRSGYTGGGTRLSKEKMTERLDNYIGGVIRLIHEGWPGLLSAFDVVNEAVTDGGADRTTGASGSEWYETFGDNSYLMKAFEFARKHTVAYGETQIKLYYNDYNTHVAAKADGIVRICGPIFRAGYLDGIGMQDHDNNSTPTAAQWIATYNKFDTICTEMAVTELDVSTQSGTNTPSEAILKTQANQYAQLFKCFVERSYKSGRGKIISVSKDGLNDTYTFVVNQSSSLWTGQFQCKPAFYAVANVGINYNQLDSLIAHADTLHESDYTPEMWSKLMAAVAVAKTARDQNYSNTVSADSLLGQARDSLLVAVLELPVTGVSDNGTAIRNFSLNQNYPNPFNPTTRITYSIPHSSHISLKVYDLLGMEVATLFDGLRQAGNYEATFHGNGLASGVYFYRLQAGGFVETKKLMLLK